MKKEFIWLSVTIPLLLVTIQSALRAAEAQAYAGPERPRVFLDTRYTPPAGNVINVPSGSDLQSALNAARPGDTIVLEAGASYLTPLEGFLLPNKPGADWVVIKTSNPGGIPLEGKRVTPANAAAMPKIITTGVFPAIRTAPGAHHYRFVGIEFAVAPGQLLNYGIITLGEGSNIQNSLDTVPHDLIIDRCYIHGNNTGDVSRGIALNSASTAVVDSFISNCHGVGFDTQAIGGWNGPGPYKIVNNYLEGAGENFMLGGADPFIADLIPSDIEFRRNHCAKPPSWNPNDPSYTGIPWSVKNILELKNAQRVLVDGNTFEYCWVDGQAGVAIQLTTRNQYGASPWSVVQDVTFTNNIVRHSAAGINFLGHDDLHPSQQTKRIKVKNNLFVDIGGPRWGGNGRLFQLIDGTADIQIDHNTGLQTGNVISADGSPHTGFAYTNNLTPHNEYGVIGSGYGVGNSTLSYYFPSGEFTKNVLAGGPSWVYPSGNYFPLGMSEVGFMDWVGGNYRLAAGSAYKNAGSDGLDIGANIDAIEAAISNQAPIKNVFDFDGDGNADIEIFRPLGGAWYRLNISDKSFSLTSWGISGDVIAPGDYDGDRRADVAIWRPSVGVWCVLLNSNGALSFTGWGTSGDIAAPADYDGDGKTDIAIFRPSEGNWYIRQSSNLATRLVNWGTNGDRPVAADYDGDGKADIAVYRPLNGTWYIINSADGSVRSVGWGISTDMVTPSDYDGDGKADVAVFRPSNGAWYILQSSNGGFSFTGWGTNGDIAAPADYDGDGKTDIAIFRPSEGNWYIRQSSDSSARLVNWGTSGDVPVPSAFVR